MNLNEKIALLAGVEIIMPDGTEEQVNSAIVDYYHSVDPETHEFLLSSNAAYEEILEAAITKIQEDAGGGNGAGSAILSANPYEGSGNGGGNAAGSGLSVPGESASPTKSSDSSGKTTTKTDKNDVTSKLAGALPAASKNALASMVDQRWDTLIAAANSTSVGAYCVDTNVRDHLKGKSFTVVNDDYKKAFNEKYNITNVIDDNEYGDPGEGGTRPIVKEGDNMRAFNTILNKLSSGGSFEVRVPDVQNQKVIGILFNRENADQSEIIKPMKDVPIFVLTELGGKVPGQPGIEVTGITSTSKTKTKNGTVDVEEKQAIAIKHRGKVDAMKTEGSKYIRYTAEALKADAAKNEYGAEEKDYSVSSVDSFRYKDKEGKDHVMRVRGKIQVPFFRRLPQFDVFGPIATANRVEALTEADKAQVARLYAAAMRSPHLQNEFSTAAGLQSLVEDLQKAAGTPAFNAADIGA